MSKNLVIVESPAKAKTINKYLGSDYTVLASIGHIKDLPMKELGVDVENNFETELEVIQTQRKCHMRRMAYDICFECVFECGREFRNSCVPCQGQDD